MYILLSLLETAAEWTIITILMFTIVMLITRFVYKKILRKRLIGMGFLASLLLVTFLDVLTIASEGIRLHEAPPLMLGVPNVFMVPFAFSILVMFVITAKWGGNASNEPPD